MFGTLDGHLVALNAHTGAVAWDRQIDDPALGYSIDGRAARGRKRRRDRGIGRRIGIRGHVDAFSIETGEPHWRWYSIPAPGELSCRPQWMVGHLADDGTGHGPPL